MYILVDSVLTSERGEATDETMEIREEVVVVYSLVSVQRYHLSCQGNMVAETEADLLPTTPLSKSKFARIVYSVNDAS